MYFRRRMPKCETAQSHLVLEGSPRLIRAVAVARYLSAAAGHVGQVASNLVFTHVPHNGGLTFQVDPGVAAKYSAARSKLQGQLAKLSAAQRAVVDELYQDGMQACDKPTPHSALPRSNPALAPGRRSPHWASTSRR